LQTVEWELTYRVLREIKRAQNETKIKWLAETEGFEPSIRMLTV
jgi:hypothetical protein